MFFGLHRGHEVLRPVARRRGQQHHVDVGRQHLLIGVEADEVMVGIDLHLIRHARIAGSADLAQRLLQVVFEDVAHGHQFHALIAVEELLRRCGAASAAAN